MLTDELQPFSRRTKLILGTGLTVILALLAWWQLIRDEQEKVPQGFVVPVLPESIPTARDGLAWFRTKEFTEKYQQQRFWLSPLKYWNAERDQRRELMQSLIDAAPEMERRLEASLQFPDWSETLLETDPAREAQSEDEDGKSKILSGPLKSMRLAVDAAKQKGDPQRVLKLYELFYKIGVRLIQEAEGTVDLMTAAFFCINYAQEGTEQLLVESDFAPEMILAAKSMLADPPLQRSDMLRAMRWDFLLYKHGMERVRAGRPFASSVEDREMTRPAWMLWCRFKPQATVNRLMMLEQIAESLTMEPGPRNRRAAADFGAFLAEEGEKPALSLHPNSFGRRLAAGRFAGGNARGWEYFEPWMMAIQSLHRCRKTALAAKCWALAHEGRRPATLQELVPEYLPEIPIDPYEGQPLGWDQATGTAYVTGDDGARDLPMFSGRDMYSVPRLQGCGAWLP